MIEVKDEILSGEPLYDISDSQGNLIYSGVRIEQITEMIQEGTPLNKILFDSIKKDLELLEAKQKLVRRYNVPVAEVPNIVTETTTPVPTTGWVAQSDGSYKNGEFTISNSGMLNAFTDNSYWPFRGNSGILKLAKSIKLTTMTFTFKHYKDEVYADNDKMIVHGSNDGVTWTELNSIGLRELLDYSDYRNLVDVTFKINSPAFYKYYKIGNNITRNLYYVYDINFTQYDVPSNKDSNYLSLNIGIDSYEEYMLCNLIIPNTCNDDFEYKLDINNLGGKVISGALAGKEYVLRYEENKFKILQEV